MIIKLKITNPALNEGYCGMSCDGYEISKYAWQYIGNVVSFVEHEAIDGLGNIVKMMEILDSRGETDVFYVTNDVYIMNDDGNTVNIIRPYCKSGEKPQPVKNGVPILKLLKALSLDGKYNGNDILVAISNLAKDREAEINIPSRSITPEGKHPALYEASKAFKNYEANADQLFKLFAGHSKYSGYSVIHALETYAATGRIEIPTPIDEEEKLKEVYCNTRIDK